MTKKIMLIMISIMAMLFFTDKINAETLKCVYGEGAGSAWVPMIAFNWDSSSGSVSFDDTLFEESYLNDRGFNLTFSNYKDIQSIETDDDNVKKTINEIKSIYSGADVYTTRISTKTNVAFDDHYILIQDKMYSDSLTTEKCPPVISVMYRNVQYDWRDSIWASIKQYFFDQDSNLTDTKMAFIYQTSYDIGGIPKIGDITVTTGPAAKGLRWFYNLFVKDDKELEVHTDYEGTVTGDSKVLREESQKNNPDDIEHLLSCWFYHNLSARIDSTLAGKSCEGNSAFTAAYQDFVTRCSEFANTFGYEDDVGDGQIITCLNLCANMKDDVADMCGLAHSSNCNSLGNKVLNWIYRIIRFVRYGIPALLIILSIMDWIKAIASENDDEMKKVTSRFAKRLIAAALIFLIPFVLDFILRMFSIPGLDPTDPFCAK